VEPAAEQAADPVRSPDVRFRSLSVTANDATLRVLEWQPRTPTQAPTLLLVAGWISTAAGWTDFLRALAPYRRVLFFESREKRSAQLPPHSFRPDQFTPEVLANDLLAACAALELDPEHTTVFGSSLGATTILEACKDGRHPARCAFLVGPSCRFHFPWWSDAVLLWPPAAYRLVVPFVLWYLRRFRVDARREPEQMQRYESTLRSAEPARLKLSAYALRGFEVWSRLETVSIPTAVAWAPSDALHGETDIRRLLHALPNATSVTAPSNRALHDARVIDHLVAFESAVSHSE
jgi:pimeloyl-ACP methyl ester carboxylesterase